ncbi:MAG: MFS transporter [Sphaerochaetaceae bacterium]|nr:MFS transporter [Sphaerochaetaceae bacterium]
MPTMFLSEQEKQKGRHHMMLAELFNGFGSNYLGDTIVFLIAAYFGASNMAMGYISSVLYMAGIVLPVVPRIFKGRNIAKSQSFAWLMRSIVSLGYIGLLFLTGKSAIALLLVVYTVFCVFRAIGIVFNDYEMKNITSLQNRGSIFARISAGYQGSSILAKLISALTTSIKALSGLGGLIGLQMVGVATSLASSYHYRHIPCRRTVEYRPGRNLFVILRESLSKPDVCLRLWIRWLFQTAFIIMGMAVPFMTSELKLSSSMVLLYSVLAVAALAVSAMIGSRFADKMGSKPLIIIASIILVFALFFWVITPADAGWPMFFLLGFFYNMSLGLILLLASRLVAAVIPDEEAVGFNTMVNFGIAVLALISGLLSGWLVDIGTGLEGMFVFGAIKLGNNYSLCFLLAFLLAAIGLFLSSHFHEHGGLSTAEAAQILFSMHGLRAFSTIERIKKTSDPMKRKMLLMGLGMNLAGVATSEIRQMLASPFSSDKVDVIRALADKPRHALVTDLAKIALDNDSFVQMEAIAALGAYRSNPIAKEALIQCLDSRWSSSRSMAAKSLARISDNDEYLARVNQMSLNVRHIDEEIDFLVAKNIMDKKGLFFKDFFISVTQMRSTTFRQTRYALLASFVKFGSPRLAHLFEVMNIGTAMDFIDEFLPEARDLEAIDKNYDLVYDAFKTSNWAVCQAFCMSICQEGVFDNDRFENLREGLLKARDINFHAFDIQDMLAMLYFSYSLRKNART